MASSSPETYFQRKKVFTLDEFLAAHRSLGRTRAAMLKLLSRAVAERRLLQLRRGLYLSGKGADHWVVASKLTPDCVLAYDGALTFHGLAELQHSIHFLTARRPEYFVHDEVVYTAVHSKDPRSEALVARAGRDGELVFTTTLERTLVDLLDRIDILHDPGTLWAAFRNAKKLDFDALLQRAETLDRATTYARLGLFLENLPGAPKKLVEQLEWRAPKTAIYFNRNDRDEDGDRVEYRLAPRWKLVVDVEFLMHLEGKKRDYDRPFTFPEA